MLTRVTRGYKCTNRQPGNTCLSVVTSPTGVLMADCEDDTIKNIGTRTIFYVTTQAFMDGIEKSVFTPRLTILFAPMFQLNFKSSDIETIVTQTAEPTTTDTSTEGLTTRAKVGTGVAICAVALLGAVGRFLLWRKRKRLGTRAHSQDPQEGLQLESQVHTKGTPYMDHSTLARAHS